METGAQGKLYLGNYLFQKNDPIVFGESSWPFPPGFVWSTVVRKLAKNWCGRWKSPGALAAAAATLLLPKACLEESQLQAFKDRKDPLPIHLGSNCDCM